MINCSDFSLLGEVENDVFELSDDYYNSTISKMLEKTLVNDRFQSIRIGSSTQNRDIFCIRSICDQNVVQPNRILLISGIHGNEQFTTIFSQLFL